MPAFPGGIHGDGVMRADRRRLLAAAALACVAPRARARCAGDATWIPDDALLADIPRWMDALGVPGLAVAAVDGGSVAWSRTWGVLHAGEPRRVEAQTQFEAASLSKPVFAYLVLQLVDEGALALERPLASYLRPDYVADDARTARITVRDVLRHSTGLPNWRKHPASEPLAAQVDPGTRVDYSGEAFFWLQLVAEHVTGLALDVLAQRRLFAPAGMHDSTYAWDAGSAERSVRGHAAPDTTAPAKEFFRDTFQAALPLAQARGKPIAQWRWQDAVEALPEVARRAPAGTVTWAGDVMSNAAASLRTTATDYARFVSLCMPQANRADWMLREPTRVAMLTAQVPAPGRWSRKTLGWNLEQVQMERGRFGPVFFHGGSNGDAFKTFALCDAAGRRGLVVFTNSGSGAALYRLTVRGATGLDLLAFEP